MDSDVARSRRAREIAERSLVRLLLGAGPNADKVVIIGGLNPDLLAPDAPVPHAGTTDVDVLVEVGVLFDRDELDFGWLEGALAFAQPQTAGWRWIDRSTGFPVAIEVLCDAQDNPGRPISLPGSDRLAAMNLHGPRAALDSPIKRTLVVPPDLRVEGGPWIVEATFASLGGYLCAKAAAMLGRNNTKDAYDFIYVALYNEGGIAAACDAIAAELVALPDLRSDVLAAARRYLRPDRAAARAFAEQTADGPEGFAFAVEDAVSAAEEIVRRLTMDSEG